MKYGVVVWFVEWVSEDGTKEECSYVRTEFFDSKKEMKKHQKIYLKDKNYRCDYFKPKWL